MEHTKEKPHWHLRHAKLEEYYLSIPNWDYLLFIKWEARVIAAWHGGNWAWEIAFGNYSRKGYSDSLELAKQRCYYELRNLIGEASSKLAETYQEMPEELD